MYHGIMHVHSTHSYDGKVPLADLKALLKERGVSFALMSEHTDELTPKSAAAFVKECEELSDSDFLFVPGFEVPYKNAHVLMIGCRDFISPCARDAHALRAWASRASFVSLAHPVRNAYEVDDDLFGVLHGVEIWNQQYDGRRVPRTRAVELLMKLREHKPTLVATGGVDLHRREHYGAPTMLMELHELTEAEVLEKLFAGAFAFGRGDARIAGCGNLCGNLHLKSRLTSTLSVAIIDAGKQTNAFLKRTGIPIPKKLRARIRSRV